MYLPVEDLYVKLLKSHNPQVQYFYNTLIWILKFFAFSYLGTAFLLKDVKLIWKYYSSVYHTAYILWAVLYVVCLILWKQHKREMKKEGHEHEHKHHGHHGHKSEHGHQEHHEGHEIKHKHEHDYYPEGSKKEN